MEVRQKVIMPSGWLGWAILAAVFLAAMLGGLAVSLTVQKKQSQRIGDEPIKRLQLSNADLSLAVPLRTESSGWNMVHFFSYSCTSCRESEARLAKDVPEWAPNVGRMLLPLAAQSIPK